MSWTHIRDTKPVARKNYRCALCGMEIPKGMKHVVRVGANCGEMIRSRMHDQCELATKTWIEEDWENTDEWTFRNEVILPHIRAEVAGEIVRISADARTADMGDG